MENKAKFIVFEGIDGAGKSTQINLLSAALAERGISCDVSTEPTKLPSGKLLRRALSGEIPTTPMQMAEMFATDRVNHNTDAECGIERLLSDGVTVISDRYYYSSLAYQGAELGFDVVAHLNLDNPDIRTPDLCIFLDLTPDKSLERIGARADVPREIYENYEYLDKTRKMFFDVFEKLRQKGERIVLIDASGTPDEIAEKVLGAVIEIFEA
jgi:dTMP kinase